MDPWLFLLVAFLSLVCEYVNATLGGGYGTLLVPALFLLGFRLLEVVPAILLSQVLTGLIAALAHHRLGNVDFRPSSRDLRLALVLGVSGSLGVLAAVLGQLRLPRPVVEAYVALMVLAIGLSLLAGLRIKAFNSSFSWKKVIGLGLVASFNKGISGGGYGPLLAGGQVLSGVGERKAISITALSETITCLVGLAGYALVLKAFSWSLTAAMALGAMVSAPLSAYSVRKADPRFLRLGMGLLITALGLAMLLKLFLS